MIRMVRHIGRLTGDLARYGWWTGAWWLPLVVVALAASAVLAVTAKTVVTPMVYVLF